MQCYDCVFTDTLPAPVNLRCMDSEVPRRLLVTWDVVTDGSSACARSSIVHDVRVVKEDDGMMIFSMNNLKSTLVEVTDSLETGQNYSIRVRTKLIHGTCETDEATVTCRTSESDDLSLTTGIITIMIIIITVFLLKLRHENNNNIIASASPNFYSTFCLRAHSIPVYSMLYA